MAGAGICFHLGGVIIAHDDKRLSWHGQISLETTKEYTQPWRIPFAQRTLFFPTLVNLAATAAGVRLAFRSTTERLAGAFLLQGLPHKCRMDLYVDGNFYDTREFLERGDFVFEGLPVGDKLIELWLPQDWSFALTGLEIDDNAKISAHVDKRKRWITYGSSITHCGGAASPSFTWPAIVARARGLNLTCLGYAGQCHLDSMIARVIRDTPADYISICAGINIYGGGSLNLRSFAQALIGSVQIIREKHPETPLLLMSPIASPSREALPNKVEWTLQDYRQRVAESAEVLREYGDKHLYYIDGRDVIGEEDASCMPDGLHPNADGYKLMGRKFLENAAPILFGS